MPSDSSTYYDARARRQRQLAAAAASADVAAIHTELVARYRDLAQQPDRHDERAAKPGERTESPSA